MSRTARTVWTIALILLAGGALLWSGMHIRLVNAESAAPSGGGETASQAVGGGLSAEEAVPQEAWQTIRGTVVSQEDNRLTIRTTAGAVMEMGLGPWGYWLAHGITLSPDDEVEIRGFVSNGEFEPAEIRNLTTGEHIVLRDEEGSPVWRGSEH